MKGAGFVVRGFFGLALAAALTVVSAEAAPAGELPRINYANPENWLCRPGHNDACDGDVTATVVHPDGTTTRERFRSDPKAPIDCFYIYPTVSRQPTPLSDMTAGPEERKIARQQFAPFASKCRLYAPLYRQITLATLEAEAKGIATGVDAVAPARDVIAAWKSYLARDNVGRGVIFIGHSQGSAILKYVIAAMFDGTPLAARLVSAILPGTDIDVLPGQDVGGTFMTLRMCHTASDTGCVIGYSSFLASRPPGDGANFSMGSRPAMRDACVNPAVLDTGGTLLRAYLPTPQGDAGTKEFATTFFEPLGSISAACVSDAKHTYLAITVKDDPRAPDVLKLLRDVDRRNPHWGLHEEDINLALGNLIDIVGTQAKAWMAHTRAAATGR
jgi:hypothetical protein